MTTSSRKTDKPRSGKPFPWKAELNSDQLQAVESLHGPLMVLSGAGSGKTRVIAYRIAHLIASRTAKEDKILALTFTNKAAGEMKNRVASLVQGNKMPPWVGTFHSLFARILRIEARRIGYTPQFSIYDETDQLRTIKEILKRGSFPVAEFTPKDILHRISSLKSRMITAPAFESQGADDFLDKIVQPVYSVYFSVLRNCNAMDFDDILLNTFLMFSNNPDILKKYQSKFKFILVDEFQDTNLLQYRILQQLADAHQNICVVGDDDQSIYGWRGAEIKNILQFEHDFDNTTVIRLERNYRSSRNILNAANSVIRNNRIRHAKQLWTEKSDGQKLTIHRARSDYAEADWIAQTILEKISKENRSWDNFAILYRMNVQSRLIEDSLRSRQIPYTIVGGQKFYERKEIKDVLAYLAIMVNSRDDVCLKRIVNYPPRGIGKTSVERLENFAGNEKISLFEAMERADEAAGLQKRRAESFKEFYKLLSKYRKLLKQLPMVELVTALIEEVKILQHLQADSVHDTLNRLENVRELLRAIDEFAVKKPDATLEEYLSEIALFTDIDFWDDSQQQVSMMTVHAAKGLEFPVVFITGAEEGIFPSGTSMLNGDMVEEERRLFYVASTRAEEALYITHADQRSIYTGLERYPPSRFLAEIDSSTVFKQDIEPAFSLYTPHRETGPVIGKRRYSDFEEPQVEEEIYRVGMRVQHDDFGIGLIRKIEGRGSSAKLYITFQGNIDKKLLVQYAKLIIVDDSVCS